MLTAFKALCLKFLNTSRGRGSGFAGPQAQRPPRGAGSYAQRATVGAHLPRIGFQPQCHHGGHIGTHRLAKFGFRLRHGVTKSLQPE